MRLKQRREELGFTQRQMADKLGIAESQYQGYEYGRLPNVKMGVKIAEALETSAHELWGDEKSSCPE